MAKNKIDPEKTEAKPIAKKIAPKAPVKKKPIKKKPVKKNPVRSAKILAEKLKQGQPTAYDPSYDELAYKICLLGATIPRLADIFKVNQDTIYEWMKVHESFSEAVKNGKERADATIAESFYNRAKGMTLKRQVAIKVTSKQPALDENGKPLRYMTQSEKIEVVEIAEEVAPDTVAGIFWLKNRQPKEWKDKQEIVNTNFNNESDQIDYSKLSDAALEEIANAQITTKSE